MPIKFPCPCGKTLQVKDEFAGRRVKCPACGGAATVPAAGPAFEVVEDIEDAPPPAPPAVPRARAVEPTAPRPARVKARPADDDEDDGGGFEVVKDDDPPPKRRTDDDAGDRPKRKQKRKAVRREEKSSFGMERGVMNSGVFGGLLAMLVAVVWFVVGLMNDFIFYYPPILFIIGLVGFIKGLAGGGDE